MSEIEQIKTDVSNNRELVLDFYKQKMSQKKGEVQKKDERNENVEVDEYNDYLGTTYSTTMNSNEKSNSNSKLTIRDNSRMRQTIRTNFYRSTIISKYLTHLALDLDYFSLGMLSQP